MLKRLSIENYALIDHLDISFPGDLVIITGETGAGKSIMLGALSLILGSKADASSIRDKSRNCVVEAEFEEGREIIARRVVSPSGRSRAFVDDEPVTLDELRETTLRLVDIHSQHQQLLLSDRKFQLSALDGFAGCAGDLEKYEALYAGFTDACRRLAALNESIAADEKERDYLEFQYDKLDKAHLKAGELAGLEAEHSVLANCGQIKDGVARACQIFDGQQHSLDADLKEVGGILSRLSAYVTGFDSLADRVESTRIELKDILEEMVASDGKIAYSPERLSEVEARISLLYDLMHKHSVDSVEALVSVRDSLSARLSQRVDRELERDSLARKVETLRKECLESAERIHAIRSEAAPRLSELLQGQIRSLQMPYAVFSIEVSRKDVPGPDGMDDIAFRFNANGGELQDLSRCASGGELSRIMLCLKSAMAEFTGMPTLIFDEIDTGVSGSIADRMGEMIVDAGRKMQVFAITHLPQVASKGSAHYLVYKEYEGGENPQTGIKKIEGEERVKEIARLLSGSKVTEAALANARVLLDNK